MICCERVSATLDGTTWVEVKEFTGGSFLWEIWFKVPNDIGTGTNVLIGLFNGSYLTDGDERYNSGAKAENSDYDLEIKRCVMNTDKLMIKADGAATKAVEFAIYHEE